MSPWLSNYNVGGINYRAYLKPQNPLENGFCSASVEAGRAGFEPAVEVYSPDNRLAGDPIRPLWHLPDYVISDWHLANGGTNYVLDSGQLSAKCYLLLKRRERDSNPRWTYAHSCFQDSRLRPLGHPSGKGRAPELAPGNPSRAKGFYHIR